MKLYECDTRLRQACFAAVGRFEIALRNVMAEELSRRFGSHPYGDFAFQSDADVMSARDLLTKTAERSKDARIIHYRRTYSDPPLPPIWTLKEVLTCGASSRLLKLLARPVQTHLARAFGIPDRAVLLQWVECLVDLRNLCAHHDRLFNRGFQKQPRRLVRHAVPSAPANKLCGLLQCLDFMLDRHGSPVAIESAVAAMIGEYPEVDRSEVGFPV